MPRAMPDRTTMAQLARQTVAIVLAGGRGARLGPLTEWRAKPAVPFGGKFKIIDFALSNCLNSGIRRIGIATQYQSHGLIHHLQRGWSFLDGRFNEFIELLPAQQSSSGLGAGDWYKGTADAVYQNLEILRRHEPRLILVLAGDHIYKMDYTRMLYEHIDRGADMTVGCVEVPCEEAAGQLGVMEVDSELRVLGFEEKPEMPRAIPASPGRCLGSMGIYVFSADFLYDELEDDAVSEESSHDFGHDLIPKLIANGGRVYAHLLRDGNAQVAEGEPYWRDVGTLDAFWEANLELTRVTPALNLYDDSWPIWTYQEQLPPAKFVFDLDGRRGAAIDSMVSGGCIVSGSTVRNSMLFSNVRVHSFCTINESVLLPEVEVGRGAILSRVLVDQGTKIPPGLRAGVDPEEDRRRFHVTEKGITLITPSMLGQNLRHLH
ncbi:MAG: glucose-1-phosphate adenylyltransferase [Burkholderiales bacterium]|nr:glucose-1-phosphate adenylyltransferase [Burkholderiales bacterium]